MESGNSGGLDSFRRALRGYRRIAIDTNILIYFLESTPRYDSYVQCLMREVEKGSLSAVVSAVVELELLVKPLRLNDRRASDDIMEFVAGFPNFEVVPVSRKIAQLAAQIRASSRIGVADAIVIATGIEESCEAVIGNDLDCSRLVTGVAYQCLEDFVRMK